MRTIAIIIAAIFLVACEKDAASSASTDDSETSAAEVAADAETSGFSVGKLRIIAAQNIYSNPETVQPEPFEEILTSALEETASHDGGAPAMSGSITYDARLAKDIDGNESRDVVLFGQLRREGDDPTMKYVAEIVVRSDTATENASFEELAKRAADQFAKRIDSQVRISGAGKDVLTTILRSSAESDQAKTAAIQEIREREITGTEPELRKILTGDNDSLKPPAAAALVKLGDEESHDEILELAQRFSREKNPALLPMLYILGDMGGPEVITYLDTVAEAHSAPAVRQVAKEAVRKAVAKQAKMRGQGAEVRPTPKDAPEPTDDSEPKAE